MDITQARQIIENANLMPEIMKSDGFIKARLEVSDLYRLILDMGPNCSLRCEHCYAKCGPDRKGLPDAKIVEKALSSARRLGINHLALTNGEPLREVTREVVGTASEYSKYWTSCVITNGLFAETQESATDWIRLMRDKGMDFSEGNRFFRVSFGKFYPVLDKNYLHINRAMKEVFPGADFGKFFSYGFVFTNDLKDNRDRINRVIGGLYEVFGNRKPEEMTLLDGDLFTEIFPDRGAPIEIEFIKIDPVGRAVNLKFVSDKHTIFKINPEDMLIEKTPCHGATISSNGEIFFNGAGGYGLPMPWGNLKKESLEDIFARARGDLVFKGLKLGGTRFVYSVAQSLRPGFVVSGRCAYDVSRAVFSDKGLVEQVRNHFENNGLIESYKAYINSTNLYVRGKV